ncbi:hypothetical protein [Pseudaminobacter salicylatoxidans]|uniref:hypothetical protein n=1 Tax=Pseudaminobacter salicylatoxidans TaxID=93369 RepID=UPI000D6BC7B2|nr:hypothetical protein [Pseudaminobacter salicylatoxidans]
MALKFREFSNGDILFADDTGGFFKSDERFFERYVCDRLTETDEGFLQENGQAFDTTLDLPCARSSNG